VPTKVSGPEFLPPTAFRSQLTQGAVVVVQSCLPTVPALVPIAVKSWSAAKLKSLPAQVRLDEPLLPHSLPTAAAILALYDEGLVPPPTRCGVPPAGASLPPPRPSAASAVLHTDPSLGTMDAAEGGARLSASASRSGRRRRPTERARESADPDVGFLHGPDHDEGDHGETTAAPPQPDLHGSGVWDAGGVGAVPADGETRPLRSQSFESAQLAAETLMHLDEDRPSAHKRPRVGAAGASVVDGNGH
jgi:hypothetical protein